MPEYPDVTVYIERLRALLAGHVLEQVKLTSPFVLRSVEPPISAANGARVRDFHNIGKRIVWELEPNTGPELFLVIHLMVAGRLRWRKRGIKAPKKGGLATFDFEHGTLLFTEASKKKRASIHMVSDRDSLLEFDRGGISFFDATAEQFAAALTRENRTLKRALTDPRNFSGIGNAYSDEILHRARLSPVQLSKNLDSDQIERLRVATVHVMQEWTDRLRAETKQFPEKVTAFRPEMAVHGKYKEPCPMCGSPVQRIRYADNETNYCPTCQTGGKLLADRALSRLLKKDWPRSLEELDELKADMRSRF